MTTPIKPDKQAVANLRAFLDQTGRGCISGNVNEWPQLKPACKYAIETIEQLEAQVAVMVGLIQEAIKRDKMPYVPSCDVHDELEYTIEILEKAIAMSADKKGTK